MNQPAKIRLRSKDAIIVHANGRPVTYLNTPLSGWLGWLVRLLKLMRAK